MPESMAGWTRHQVWCKSVASVGAVCNCGADQVVSPEQARADLGVAGVVSEPMSGEQRLRKWWVDLAREEVEKVVPKAIEYGATDLVEIGRHLREAGVKMPSFVGERERQAIIAELGVYFYVIGKMARWADAVAHGRLVSDDTLHDIGVYVRMAQRIRAAGSWPGVDNNETEGPGWMG